MKLTQNRIENYEYNFYEDPGPFVKYPMTVQLNELRNLDKTF